MEAKEKLLVLEMLKRDMRLQRLYQEHVSLEERLSTFHKRPFLTGAEESERKRLKQRKLRGVVHRMPVSGGYGNLEEFLATLVANIYRSEKGKPPLNYRGQDIDPAKFLDTDLSPTPRLLIATFRGKQPDFFAALSAIEAEFNPVHQVDAEAGAAMKRAANG